MFTIDPKSVGPLCIKMLPSNFTFILALAYIRIGCENPGQILIFSLDNPFDFHDLVYLPD